MPLGRWTGGRLAGRVVVANQSRRAQASRQGRFVEPESGTFCAGVSRCGSSARGSVSHLVGPELIRVVLFASDRAREVLGWD
jgi:hypothetical protein